MGLVSTTHHPTQHFIVIFFVDTILTVWGVYQQRRGGVRWEEGTFNNQQEREVATEGRGVVWGRVGCGRQQQQRGRLGQQQRVRGEGDSGSLIEFGLKMSELEYGKGEELEGKLHGLRLFDE